MATTTKSFA